MSVAWARSSERQASNPRRPGTSSSTSRSRRSATSVSGSICMCTYLGRKVFARASIQWAKRPRKEKERSVSIELQFDLDPSIKREFGTLAGGARVTRTAAALEANGFRVLRAANAAEAKRIVLDLLPDGSQVHHGASQSLEVSGVTDEIEKSG